MDEAVLLGQAIVAIEGEDHLAGLDRADFDAERLHHRLLGEARQTALLPVRVGRREHQRRSNRKRRMTRSTYAR
jgi:hypothetical protein